MGLLNMTKMFYICLDETNEKSRVLDVDILDQEHVVVSHLSTVSSVIVVYKWK